MTTDATTRILTTPAHIITSIDPEHGRELGILNVGTGTFFEVFDGHELIGAVHPAPSTEGEWGFVTLDGRKAYGFESFEAAAHRGPGWVGGIQNLPRR